jgi:hypothetical protein
MDDATQMLVDGIETIEDAVGATITWKGEVYPCVGGTDFSDKILSLGGFKLGQSGQIVARASLFEGNQPQEEQTLVYKSVPDDDGRTLRIKNVTDFRKALLVFECIDPTS